LNKLLLFFFLTTPCFARSYGQTVTGNYSYGRIVVAITKEENPENIYATVENKSAFPAADSSWVRSLEKNINRTIQLDKGVKEGKYIVAVKFIVAKDGTLSDIQCENDPGFGMCGEVIRVIKKSKNWVPAQQNGRQVREYRRG
jgi:periplasmic protein TonB